MRDQNKYVDESWKEHAAEEKSKLADNEVPAQPESKIGESPVDPVEPEQTDEKTRELEINFLNYVTSLGFQAMIFMGEIPSPITNTVEQNLDQAKFLIETLDMIKGKTAGNLSAEESSLLENSIYELQMRYVQVVQGKASLQEKPVQ